MNRLQVFLSLAILSLLPFTSWSQMSPSGQSLSHRFVVSETETYFTSRPHLLVPGNVINFWVDPLGTTVYAITQELSTEAELAQLTGVNPRLPIPQLHIVSMDGKYKSQPIQCYGTPQLLGFSGDGAATFLDANEETKAARIFSCRQGQGITSTYRLNLIQNDQIATIIHSEYATSIFIKLGNFNRTFQHVTLGSSQPMITSYGFPDNFEGKIVGLIPSQGTVVVQRDSDGALLIQQPNGVLTPAEGFKPYQAPQTPPPSEFVLMQTRGTSPQNSALVATLANQENVQQQAFLSSNALLYNAITTTNKALYVTPLGLQQNIFHPVQRKVYEEAKKEDVKAIAMNQAKTVGLGLLIYSADFQGNFPAGKDWEKTILPYLTNNEILNGFTYLGNGESLKNLESPATYRLGIVSTEYGTATVFADGHVQWQDNP